MAWSADQIKQHDELVQKRNALQMLMSHSGWKYVVEEFTKAGTFAYDQMTTTDNPHQSAKHMGSYHACENIRKYPETEVVRLTKLINMIEAQRQG